MGAGSGFGQSVSSGGAGTITGSGTTNYVAKFTGATAIGNSQIFDDGTNVGIGITGSFLGKVHIKGTSDVVQCVIQANATQAANEPLLKFVDSAGLDLCWINVPSESNMFFGKYSGGAIDVGGGGIDNTCFGFGTGTALTIGTYSCFFGKRAGEANTTGQKNIAIGAGAFLSNQTGSDNIAIGYHSNWQSTAVGQNVSIGSNSMDANTTGVENVVIGHAAVLRATSSKYMAIVGKDAFNFMTAGDYNTGFGYSAGYTNTTGARNTYIGAASGYTSTGSGNVFLGYFSGFLETGGDTFFVDNQNRGTEAAGRTDSLIYGLFNATRTSQRLAFNAKVGINGPATSTSVLNVTGLPTSAVGLATGDVWNNLGILTIV